MVIEHAYLGSMNLEVMEKWFDSDVWEDIIHDGDRGCPDSIELMEEISQHLGSLTWHLQNQSSEDRIIYELRYFSQLCDDFEVAEE